MLPATSEPRAKTDRRETRGEKKKKKKKQEEKKGEREREGWKGEWDRPVYAFPTIFRFWNHRRVHNSPRIPASKSMHGKLRAAQPSKSAVQR